MNPRRRRRLNRERRERGRQAKQTRPARWVKSIARCIAEFQAMKWIVSPQFTAKLDPSDRNRIHVESIG